jgi:hypothetical protein
MCLDSFRVLLAPLALAIVIAALLVPIDVRHPVFIDTYTAGLPAIATLGFISIPHHLGVGA